MVIHSPGTRPAPRNCRFTKPVWVRSVDRVFRLQSLICPPFRAHAQKLSGGEAVAAAYVEHSQARFDIAPQSKNGWQKVAVHVTFGFTRKAKILVVHALA